MVFSEKYWLNLYFISYNQVSLGKKTLRIFGPNIKNSLPYHIKSSKNLESFKNIVKTWDGVDYKCVISKKGLNHYFFFIHFSFAVMFIH